MYLKSLMYVLYRAFTHYDPLGREDKWTGEPWKSKHRAEKERQSMETMTKKNVYTENGFSGRKEYLKSLSDEYGLPISTVLTVANTLGASEDFDGLITILEESLDYDLVEFYD